MEFHDIVICYDDTTRDELYNLLLEKNSLFHDIYNVRCHEEGHSVDQIRIKLIDIVNPSRTNDFITIHPDKCIDRSNLSQILKEKESFDEFSLANLLTELEKSQWHPINRTNDWNVRTFYLFSKRNHITSEEDLDLATDIWHSYLEKKLPIGKRRNVFVLAVPQFQLWCEMFETWSHILFNPYVEDYDLDYDTFIENMNAY